MKTKVAIFASGSGSNAENLIRYFEGHGQIEICHVYTNNASAGVILRAHRLNIPVTVFTKSMVKDGMVLNWLKSTDVEYLILAGYLWLIPADWITEFSEKIINLHPALLPKYGGKGMYGMNVHKAVIADKANESGITIHLVDENYDTGSILFQKSVLIDPKETPESLVAKIHELEHEHLPRVVEEFILDS